MEAALRDMIEREAIKELKARYFRSVDTFDLEGWVDCFTEDCRLRFDTEVQRRGAPPVPIATLEGRQAVIDYWNSNSDRMESVHHGHMPEIEIQSDTEARGIWAMEDIVEFTDGLLHGYGHYHETYRKTDGKWRIATLHLTRVRISETAK
jgi:hypothetical protein